MQTTFLQETAFGMFKASMQTDLEHQKTAMKRDCDAVRAECEKLRTGARGVLFALSLLQG